MSNCCSSKCQHVHASFPALTFFHRICCMKLLSSPNVQVRPLFWSRQGRLVTILNRTYWFAFLYSIFSVQWKVSINCFHYRCVCRAVCLSVCNRPYLHNFVKRKAKNTNLPLVVVWFWEEANFVGVAWYGCFFDLLLLPVVSKRSLFIYLLHLWWGILIFNASFFLVSSFFFVVAFLDFVLSDEISFSCAVELVRVFKGGR